MIKCVDGLENVKFPIVRILYAMMMLWFARSSLGKVPCDREGAVAHLD